MKGEWNFGNIYARNVIFFGADNNSSFLVDSLKNNFLILGKWDIFGINGSFGAPEKKFSIKFSKANTNFSLSLSYNADISYLFVNGKEIFKFKAVNENLHFPTQFYLEGISNEFSNTEPGEVSLNRDVYEFSLDYNSIDKSDILNIHK